MKIQAQNIRHIHEVIHLIQHSEKAFNAIEVAEEVGKLWGENVEFANCSGVTIQKEDAVEFLLKKNKILIESGKIVIHPTIKLCQS
ncbi:MAG: DUF2492 family protein [Cyclobacteriaceae bacterium]